MEKKIDSLRFALQESLRFALTPSAHFQRYGNYGLDLMKQMIDIGYHLPLFAAVDIVSSFFTASNAYYSFQPTLSINDPGNKIFKETYNHDYQNFLHKTREFQAFKKIGILRNLDKIWAGKTIVDEDKFIYQTIKFILMEMATSCPFVKIIPIYSQEALSHITWESLSLPERTPFSSPEKERELLSLLRLNGRFETSDFRNYVLVKNLIKKEIIKKDQKVSNFVYFNDDIAEEHQLKNDLEEIGLSEMSIESTLFLYRQTISPIYQEHEKEESIRILTETCFHVYSDKTDDHLKTTNASSKTSNNKSEEEGGKQWHQEKKYLQALSLTQHLFDHKLVDLYRFHHDKYEPSDKLRHKIAELAHLTRSAIDRSLFYTEYSKLGKQGFPIPTYLSQGWKYFLFRVLSGEHVFFDNDPPIREQDNIAIRFFLVEEIISLSEKLMEESSWNFPHHLTTHKLISLLLCHDIVKYLGGVSDFDVSMQFYTYNEAIALKEENYPIRYIKKSMKKVLSSNSIKGPFLTRIKDIQKELFMEASAINVGRCRFDKEFFQRYEKDLSSSISSSAKYNVIFNIFFGRGGSYLEGNKNFSFKEIKDDSFYLETGELSLTKELIDSGSLQNLLYQPTSFVCETNDRYLISSCNQYDRSLFTLKVTEQALPHFLNLAREYFLNLIVDEAIKLKSDRKL